MGQRDSQCNRQGEWRSWGRETPLVVMGQRDSPSNEGMIMGQRDSRCKEGGRLPGQMAWAVRLPGSVKLIPYRGAHENLWVEYCGQGREALSVEGEGP